MFTLVDPNGRGALEEKSKIFELLAFSRTTPGFGSVIRHARLQASLQASDFCNTANASDDPALEMIELQQTRRDSLENTV
jgi:hypothetical protein